MSSSSPVITEVSPPLAPEPGSQQLELLFSTEFSGHPAYIYFIFITDESQLPCVPLRMLASFVQIWQRHQDQHGGPLPLILPTVWCAVPGAGSVPKRFQDMFEPHPKSIAKLEDLLPQFTLRVTSMTDASDEELHAWAPHGFSRAVMFAIRDMHDPDRLLASFDQWAAALDEATADPEAPRHIPQLFRFVLTGCPQLDLSRLRLKLRERSPELQGMFLYTYLQMREEGHFDERAAAPS